MEWRDLLFKPPTHIKYGLAIAALVWAWLGFKEVEPVVYPVVSDFEILEVKQYNSKTEIAGTLTKQRDCEFKEVIAVADNKIVSIEFQETAYHTTGVVSRPVGTYDWGWWAVIPRVSKLQLYSRHTCNTGEVLTNLWEGEL